MTYIKICFLVWLAYYITLKAVKAVQNSKPQKEDIHTLIMKEYYKRNSESPKTEKTDCNETQVIQEKPIENSKTEIAKAQQERSQNKREEYIDMLLNLEEKEQGTIPNSKENIKLRKQMIILADKIETCDNIWSKAQAVIDKETSC